jgi:hypothetical protein
MQVSKRKSDRRKTIQRRKDKRAIRGAGRRSGQRRNQDDRAPSGKDEGVRGRHKAQGTRHKAKGDEVTPLPPVTR